MYLWAAGCGWVLSLGPTPGSPRWLEAEFSDQEANAEVQ